MKNITESLMSKLNLYDHIGYLLVGSIGLLILTYDLWLLEKSNIMPVVTFENAIIWLVVTYFTGHVVQAIANVVTGWTKKILKEDKDSYSSADQAILKDAKVWFGFKDMTDRETFQYCYMLACAKDITGHVTAFNAYYSLYRGWLVIFTIQTGFLVIYLILNWPNWNLLFPVAGSAALTYLMNNRRRRFWQYLGSKVLQTFVVLRRIER